MKTHIPSLLHLEDIRPYTSGFNVLECTDLDPSGQPTDVFVGEIARIDCLGGDIVSAAIIKMRWVVRIREPVDTNGHSDSESFEPIPESRKLNYEFRFEHPQLIQKRSPLVFRSIGEIIKISHVTKLAKVVLELKAHT